MQHNATKRLRIASLAKDLRVDAETIRKDTLRTVGVTWSASRKGDVYVGPTPNGMGAFCYQYEGNKLMATVDALQMTMYTIPHFKQLLEDEAVKMKTNFLELMQAGPLNMD